MRRNRSGQIQTMTSLAATELNARTGPPSGDHDDWIAYVWMAIFTFLMVVGFQALILLGAL